MTTMPAEWSPHARTWMAFPVANSTFGAEGSTPLGRARTAWARVAATIARYEPVTMVAAPGDEAVATSLLPDDVTVVTQPLDDAWIRDTGPTFVTDDAGTDGILLRAVDWTFNGWGAQSWAAWENDARLGRRVADLAGAPVHDSSMVTEGGGFHIDGRGSVLLTDTVQLDPARNPGWTREDVEREIHLHLGTTHAIWLPRGLSRDYDEFGTRGHVDIVAAFTPGGQVLLHRQDDPAHPDHEVTRALRRVLEESTDATGHPLRILDLPAPSTLRDAEGEWVDYSYINHYVCNGAVILCAFGDPDADERAREILRSCYPDRTVELVDARDVFAFGGGIHCITQQQPRTPHA
ncbi:Agmatine deiminase OS=Tsukamurella paurometabola (strain ATCC 8368 / DSM / CCUG 35730 / CIP 100753 / JCM 10117 / KCTC 9821 / NBRC 16120 / NCIMB 702349 /NCTC 13040) OX=521096 GN=Tpau_0681 PE=4 SV=1 [Tsukamurella paurometabola]|uniref:Agmatine deiminase n=1 Tax=Tsukamurella paurometabola (strain ATCC 8368 / DSM 20162 / CCUG 35730 / CIP 100753 / JCM 10117 / KCTC 9821 / NBRC 16120 / NCIMB 702349 / NCTC 13040) TaxID=521096 RepID=D5UT31_TSUPD|nr:agmatine deiminase family protein [Tsukamurella paurometabola]ADG77318.1 Agmatine deiminase [Tsukamurella paurometabola DSM 20162]SUP43476.1 Putative agmatine deiminase [Tsukamurella paurometabola]